ncbi:hypothetical protein CC1G_01959 [Coprinopsis cinerea okayama7|uniref:Inositol phospholipid biosynthesis protein Scs3 n=1 Tax=Coprinopsis cinerea (strain Okayama-7 / 130 / ATCC MYA-4618 / FGSC 9003) TaxID=240176 RepID=A8N639_COPC7|nr:hypothetical protein CC1G_01959 [Coprinopsis cinerea okayama7\|eukprot:XP_001830323.1 hypothetical protein CC1G_01959 [Coprinopsis cinerea okayama7\
MGFQRSIFYLLSTIVLVGTVYSVLYDTYLDTSDPFLTHLPHPLSHSHYFASKKNWLNVYFIKKAWGWTSAVFLLNWLTTPTLPASPASSPNATRTTTRTSNRLLLTFLTLTAVWILFTNWFFGPALLERVVLASGGQCMLPGPGNTPLVLPTEYCFTKSTISAESHPDLFQSLFTTPNVNKDGSPGLNSEAVGVATFTCPPTEPDCIQNIRGIPRLRKGHDVSGHLFLLTMSVLLLSKQLQVSLGVSRSQGAWSTLHTFAVALNGVLLGLWLLASATTSVYFHSPWEKLTGFLLGAVGYAVSQAVTSVILPEPAGAYTRTKVQ